MKRGQEVVIKFETVSSFVKTLLTTYQRYNNPKVSKFNKKTNRVELSWPGQNKMWFDLEQVEKIA